MNNREKWVYHPLLVIQEYRKIADASFVSILLSDDSAENPLNSTITVVEEGYPDDSVRGQWFQFHLGRENSEKGRLLSLYDFENRKKIFPSVNR